MRTAKQEEHRLYMRGYNAANRETTEAWERGFQTGRRETFDPEWRKLARRADVLLEQKDYQERRRILCRLGTEVAAALLITKADGQQGGGDE